MPPPAPPIPGWPPPPLSKLELVRSSDAAAPPTGCPGPIGLGGPDGIILRTHLLHPAPPTAAEIAGGLCSATHLATASAPRHAGEIRGNRAGTAERQPPCEQPETQRVSDASVGSAPLAPRANLQENRHANHATQQAASTKQRSKAAKANLSSSNPPTRDQARARAPNPSPEKARTPTPAGTRKSTKLQPARAHELPPRPQISTRPNGIKRQPSR